MSPTVNDNGGVQDKKKSLRLLRQVNPVRPEPTDRIRTYGIATPSQT